MSDDDAAAVSAAYTEDNGIWTLNDTAQLPELERIFIRPLVMYARLSEQGANTVLALRQQMQGGLITHEEILARGEEASAAWARSPTASCAARPCSFSRRSTPSRG